MTRWGCMLLVAVLGLGVGAYFSRKPWQLLAKQRGDQHQTLRQLEEIEVSQMDVVRQKMQLDSPLGREVLARAKGWRRPEERPLILP